MEECRKKNINIVVNNTPLVEYLDKNMNEAIHRASPVYIVKCGIIGTGLVYTLTHSIDGAT